MKRVLFLGAAGLIGPHLTPGLRDHYDLRLADVKPHPEGLAVAHMDVRDYEQVLAAAAGCDAIMSFTGVHSDPVDSFLDNTVEPPTAPPPFFVLWPDLQPACRLALEVPSLPGGFQTFNLLSFRGPGKDSTDKARRRLGFEPTRDWDALSRRGRG